MHWSAGFTGVLAVWLTFCAFVLNGLLEERDVSEGAEEQHHLVVLIFNGRHLHVEPYWRSCGGTESQ